jgi:hypothetical protein
VSLRSLPCQSALRTALCSPAWACSWLLVGPQRHQSLPPVPLQQQPPPPSLPPSGPTVIRSSDLGPQEAATCATPNHLRCCRNWSKTNTAVIFVSTNSRDPRPRQTESYFGSGVIAASLTPSGADANGPRRSLAARSITQPELMRPYAAHRECHTPQLETRKAECVKEPSLQREHEDVRLSSGSECQTRFRALPSRGRGVQQGDLRRPRTVPPHEPSCSDGRNAVPRGHAIGSHRLRTPRESLAHRTEVGGVLHCDHLGRQRERLPCRCMTLHGSHIFRTISCAVASTSSGAPGDLSWMKSNQSRKYGAQPPN